MGFTTFSFILLPLSLIWALSPIRLLKLLLYAAVFEAAAALTVGSFGLQPGMVPAFAFFGYVALQMLLGAQYPGTSRVLSLAFPFVIVTIYAVIGSFVLPRLFEDVVFVWPQKPEPPYILTALAPSASNFNQDFYLVLNCLLLVVVAMFLGRPGVALRPFLQAYLGSGFLVAAIAIWQFASKVAGVPYPDAFFYSNPGWLILTAQSIGGMPRINGPFSEPSSLGAYMGSIVCASGWLLLKGHRDRLLKILFITGLGTMILSTSTTGFALLAVMAAGVPAAALVSGSMGLLSKVLKIALPLLAVVLVLYGALSIFMPEINQTLGQIFSATLDKRQSSSYDERTSTDLDSMAVALDTYGLGAGWGSNRSSSLIPGLMASVGIPGCAGLVWFGVALARRARAARRPAVNSENQYVVDGCCGALSGYLTGAAISAPTLTSVTFFFLLALLIAAVVQIEMGRARDHPTNGSLSPAKRWSPVRARPVVDDSKLPVARRLIDARDAPNC